MSDISLSSSTLTGSFLINVGEFKYQTQEFDMIYNNLYYSIRDIYY